MSWKFVRINFFVGQKVPSPTPPGKKISSQKRRRNYSSYECGAKIVAANNEAEGTSRILNELVDEYMLNPCKAKIWFVIELCETVQASQVSLIFEIFCLFCLSIYRWNLVVWKYIILQNLKQN